MREEEKDFIGTDGLLYCGICKEPKEAFLPKAICFGNFDRHPSMCACMRAEVAKEESRARQMDYRNTIERLRTRCFQNKNMLNWRFENDNGMNEKMKLAKNYVEKWETVKEKNHGLLLWGSVGTGKSYMAGCIANALLDKAVSVHMTNFAKILNDLQAKYDRRNEYINYFCGFQLLIIDDLGVERGTEYGLEQLYNVIDSRYRTGKPFIVTTNLTLNEIKNTTDLSYKRIYDRVLEMCTPIRIDGASIRDLERKDKMRSFKEIMM